MKVITLSEHAKKAIAWIFNKDASDIATTKWTQTERKLGRWERPADDMTLVSYPYETGSINETIGLFRHPYCRSLKGFKKGTVDIMIDTEKMTDMLVQRNLQRSKETKFNAISSFSCATFDMAVKMQKLLNRLAECDKAQTNEEYVLIEEALVYFSEQIQRHFRTTFGHKMVLEVNVEKD
jgi:hypothetical protein